MKRWAYQRMGEEVGISEDGMKRWAYLRMG